MDFINKVKTNIANDKLPIEFSVDDLKKCNDITKNDMKYISNYNIKNTGSSNRNKKVLISRKINNIIYYTFEKEFIK